MAFSDFMRFTMTFDLANDVFDVSHFKAEIYFVFGFVAGRLVGLADDGRAIGRLAQKQGEVEDSHGSVIGSWSVE